MKLKLIFLSLIVLLSYAGTSWSMGCHGHGKHKGAMTEHSSKDTSTAVEVGNKICPVSGENVKSMGGGSEYEYDGKIYNLCCPGCANMFEKDPEKYSKIAEENAAQESEKEDHKGHHHHAH